MAGHKRRFYKNYFVFGGLPEMEVDVSSNPSPSAIPSSCGWSDENHSVRILTAGSGDRPRKILLVAAHRLPDWHAVRIDHRDV